MEIELYIDAVLLIKFFCIFKEINVFNKGSNTSQKFF